MSTNPNLQQINVFSKGMNTDTSDAFLSNEQYRYAENLRFVAEKGSTSTGGELCTIEGWMETKLDLTGITVLGVQSIRKYIIIVGKKSDGWYVWSVDTEAEDWEPITHFGPCTDDIGNNISIVTRWESDKNIKIYIADGKNQLMSLNIADNKYSGNDIKNISGKLELSLPQLQTRIIDNQESRITAPILQYAYVLYKLGGQQTSISPLTTPIFLYSGDRGYYEGETITNTVELSLTGIDTDQVDRIKLYRIGYTQNGQDPDISLIYDDTFLNNQDPQFQYIDNGFDILQITASEFQALSGIEFKPLLIESKNDYLFAANVQYNQQEIDDLFENCTAWYEPVLGDTYDIDLKNNVSEGGVYTASFKRGETYRFGIVFYDKKGRKSSVIKNTIHDIYIPGVGDQNYHDVYSIVENGKYRAYPYKIIAHVNNIPDECSGIELVRCKRGIKDSVNICQGIIGRAQQIQEQSIRGDLRFMFPYMTTDKYIGISNTPSGSDMESCNDCLMFASPEYCYQADDIKQILNSYKSHINIQTVSKFEIPFRVGGSTQVPKIIEGDDRGYDIYNDMFAIGDGSIVSSVNDPAANLYPNQNSILNNVESGCNLRWDSDQYCYKFKYGSSYYDPEEGKLQLIREYGQDNITEHVVYMSKLYPTRILNSGGIYKTEIESLSYTDSPDGHSFEKNGEINIDNDKTGNRFFTFINWDASAFYDETGVFDNTGVAENDLKITTGFGIQFRYGVTAGKKCILIKPGKKYTLDPTGWRMVNTEYNLDEISINSLFNGSIVNIVNTNATPYGGDSEASKNNSIFYSFGDYVPYSKDPNSPHYHSSASEVSIITTNGDCYICNFIYNSAHCWDSGTYKAAMYPTVYIVPVESDINLKATYGDLYTRMDSIYRYWFQDRAGKIGKLTQEKDAYLYNTMYNGSLDLMSYTPLSYTSISNDKFDCRVHCSQIKTNGEYTDSWLNFKAADFIDVDTRYGEITDLNLFKDTLVFWQNNAAGVLSVNERTLLQDVNDTNIILGNGDVLQRYDYLTTEYGMKPNQKARTQSNNALYWWDGYKKEILQYPGGREVLPLKKIKTVSRYVNSIKESTKPCLAFDHKYAEIIMHLGEDDISNKTMSLVYNEYIQQFTSLYNSSFEFSSKLLDKLLLIKNRNIYKWNERGNFINFIPTLKYVVNKDSTFVKVFDNIEFGMGDKFLYDSFYTRDENDYEDGQCYLDFEFKTQGQSSKSAKYISHREYDLRMAIPRDGENLAGGSGRDVKSVYGNRMRGRTMQCTLTNNTLDVNFSLQYIVTKYRISNS